MVAKPIFRIDDVNPNTDFTDLEEQLRLLSPISSIIYLGINLFGYTSKNGSIYPDLPLKDQERTYFYKINKVFRLSILAALREFDNVEVVSHGLIHNPHDKMDRDGVEMSILSSCSLLNTRIFIPPFNAISQTVIDVCKDNDIELICNKPDLTWRSLETHFFDPSQLFWYYHPWRMDAKRLKERLG